MLQALLEFLGSFLFAGPEASATRRGFRIVVVVLAVMLVLAIAWGLTEIL